MVTRVAAGDESDGTPAWKIAVEVLGALAGVALILYFVGGLIFAARLHALSLPVDAGVAFLPGSTLVVAAVRALALALVVGAVVLVLVRALDPISARRRSQRRLHITTALLFALLGAPVAHVVLTEPIAHWLQIVLIGVAILAFALAWLAVLAASSHRVLAYQLAAIVLVLGTVLRAVAEIVPPTSMDFMSVRLKSGHKTDGFYLAADSGTIFLVPNVGGRSIGIITAVPRSEVASMQLSLYSEEVRPIGSKLPRALIGRFASQRELPKEKERRRDELARFAAGVRSHTGWRFPPVVPPSTLQFLLNNYDTFYGPAEAQEFPTDAERVPLEALLRSPDRYTGFAVVVRGRVTASAPVWTVRTARQRYIAVRDPAVDDMEATCYLTRPRPFGIPLGSMVDLHVTVLAWGSFNIRAGDTVEQTLLACASARAVKPRQDERLTQPRPRD